MSPFWQFEGREGMAPFVQFESRVQILLFYFDGFSNSSIHYDNSSIHYGARSSSCILKINLTFNETHKWAQLSGPESEPVKTAVSSSIATCWATWDTGQLSGQFLLQSLLKTCFWWILNSLIDPRTSNLKQCTSCLPYYFAISSQYPTLVTPALACIFATIRYSPLTCSFDYASTWSQSASTCYQ